MNAIEADRRTKEANALMRQALDRWGHDKYNGSSHPIVAALQGAQPRCVTACTCFGCGVWRAIAIPTLTSLLSENEMSITSDQLVIDYLNGKGIPTDIKWVETLRHHAAHPDPISVHCAMPARLIEDVAAHIEIVERTVAHRESALKSMDAALLGVLSGKSPTGYFDTLAPDQYDIVERVARLAQSDIDACENDAHVEDRG